MKYLIYILCFAIMSCKAQPPEKINGVSFVASSDKVTEENVKPLVNINANYATLMPFGFLKHLNYPELKYNANRQWFGETKEGIIQYVEELRKANIKIMLKPQIWVFNGEFTGYIKMKNEEDWIAFENSYKTFILDFAKLAETLDLEILCIGTELEAFVANRPKFWTQLIQDIKTVYSGKLTYASNWDEFKRISFWSDLDFIGVDAYFPVSDLKTPTVESCKKGWQEHKTIIKSISEKYDKPILFTEFGYRSVDYNAKAPWEHNRSDSQANLVAQNNAYQALFDEFWNEPWFAGGFLWKWFIKDDEVGGEDDNQFTPQNKPVELIIKRKFAQF